MSFNMRTLRSDAGTVARRAVVAGLAGALTLALVGCGGSEQTSTGATASTEAAVEQADTSQDGAADTDASYYEAAAGFTLDPTDLFSDRDLAGDYDADDAVTLALSDEGTEAAEGVEVDGSTITITDAGTYVLTGMLTDGRVVVDVDDADKVQLVLDGASVTSSTGTALYVRNADKVFLTLADGAANTLASTGAATEEDDHTLDGTVFASDDLTINGAGALEVTSAQGSGIVGKDELTLTGGTLDVTAADHAIQAKDSLAVADGTYTLEAGTDGIHVAHDTNGEKGFAYFAGGTLQITAASDGIDASNDILIDGGTFVIAADDDGIHSEYDLVINDGTIDVTQSYEGLEGATYEQNGGDIRVVASDDGVNAVGNPDDANGGEDMDFGMQGGPQGMGFGGQDGAGQDGSAQGDAAEQPEAGAPDGAALPEGEAPDGSQDGHGPMGGRGPRGGMGGDMGTLPEDMEPGQAPEGMGEGQAPAETGEGQAPEGMEPPSDGTDGAQMGRGGGMGGGMMDTSDTASLTINGGKIVVDASGDGLDSNGTLTMAGGEAYVSGPTNDGNGALDYGTTATVTGGILVATGSSGMAETFGTDSTQGSMLVAVSGNAGDLVELKDADDKVLASFAPTKQFTSVVVTAPGVEAGATYTVEVAGTATEVTLDSVSYRNVQSTMGHMMGNGGMGGHGPMGDQQDQGQQDTTAA